MNFRSSNPALRKTFDNIEHSNSLTEVMTVKGTINKTILSLLLVLAAAFYTWNMFIDGNSLSTTLMYVGGIGGFIVAIVTIFKKEWAPFTVPIYAILEGLFLGGISAFIAASVSTDPQSAIDNQIVIKAVSLTFGVFFVMLFLYRSGIIKVTSKFKMGVFAATGGIAVVYLMSFVMSMFGSGLSFLHDSSLLSIGISLFIVGIAALNLALDFDFIEKGAHANAPKYMEWYGAFGLLVTLIWLYIEILRLLSKIYRR